MMRLFSQVKFCFQKCQFRPEVTYTILSLNETQKSSLPRILVVKVWVLQKVLSRLTLIFHIPALSGFSWTRKVRGCFCAFSSLAVLGEPSLCLWEVTQSKPVSGTEPGALLAPSLDLSAFWLPFLICSRTLQGVMSVVTRIGNSLLMNTLLQLCHIWLGNQIVPVGFVRSLMP